MSDGLAVNFDSDIRSEVMKYLPYDRADENAISRLTDLSTRRLLIVFLNWRERLIHTHPRCVHVSREFSNNPLYHSRKLEINAVLEKIRIGGDLNPHLSERVLHGYFARSNSRPLGDNPSLDFLLNEWGMHHLHIAQTPGRNGFLARSKRLLIALFRDEAAFIVDIVEHTSWADPALVEIAIRNWPTEGFFVELVGALGGGSEITASERMLLRRAGASTSIVFDGRVFQPASGGISTAGTSALSSMDALRILDRLNRYEISPQTLFEDMQACRNFDHLQWPAEPDIRFRFAVTDFRYSCVLAEETTGLCLFLQ